MSDEILRIHTLVRNLGERLSDLDALHESMRRHGGTADEVAYQAECVRKLSDMWAQVRPLYARMEELDRADPGSDTVTFWGPLHVRFANLERAIAAAVQRSASAARVA
jgi:hypothetical protein